MKFLDLFAGIGGFRLGMEAAGHECVGYVERDKFARKSYEAIHNTEGEWTAHDITNVTDDTIRGIGSIDIICGGFPCQAFSIAGKRKGFEDIRGTLFFEIMRFASILRPRYLFLENVAGLLNHDEGNTFETILRTLDEVGYDAEWDCLNSKEYVPQNRERVFIIGHLRGTSGRKVFPIKNNNKQINELQGQQGYSNTLTARYAGKSQGSYVVECEQHAQKIRIRDNVKKGYVEASVGDGIRLDHIEGTTGRGRIQKRISPTLTTSCQSGVILQGFELRQFTPRECWRLQGFPDWAFEKAAEVNSDSQLYKQAGNSVTVNVIEAIAKELY